MTQTAHDNAPQRHEKLEEAPNARDFAGAPRNFQHIITTEASKFTLTKAINTIFFALRLQGVA